MDMMRGCCSQYRECSDKKMCLHAADPDYAGCSYRRNLEDGRIFYGVHADGHGIIQKHPNPPKKVQHDTSIFLYCYDRLFSVLSRQKNGFSLSLTPEQAEKIEAAFVDAGIPYKLQIDSQTECIIDYPSEEEPAPANSRVVFEIASEEFHLLNYNTWLIKKQIAERIRKAFDNHFIPARVELRGQYANIDRTATFGPAGLTSVKVEVIDMRPARRQEPKDPGKGSQISLFDIVSATSPGSAKVIPMPRQASVDLPIGSIIIAKDEYWGTYRAELTDIFYHLISRDIKQVKARIIENLVYPSQVGILQASPCPRTPYAADSIQVFYLANCKVEGGQNADLSATG